MLALGPFAVVTLAALLLGRLPVAMWGYPLWSFAPLAALLWFGPVTDPPRLDASRWAAVVVLRRFPLAYLVVEGVRAARVRDRPKATQFPGRLLAETVTRPWRERFGTRFPMSAAASSRSTISRCIRPTVRMSFSMPSRVSPWIDRDALRNRGAVLVWEDGQVNAATLAQMRSDYPGLEVQEPIMLPRQTFFARGAVHPVRVHFAIVPPRP